MRYLITVAACARRTSPHTFAVESAFAQHLRELKEELGSRFTEIVVAMPWMDDTLWDKLKGELTTIDETAENIRFAPMYRFGCGKAEFVRSIPGLLPRVAELVKESDLIHSNFSYDIFRPLGAFFCLFAVAMKKPVFAVDDIDRRRDAEMFYKTGRWSKRTYLMCKYLYDPMRDLLAHIYVRNIDMMLFKELQQVEDYGKGRENVRLFLDPNFSEEHVVDDAFIKQKIAALSDDTRPLRVLYFGRFVPYKGIDRMLDAVAIARSRGAKLTFSVMGSGDQNAALRAQVERLQLSDIVTFIAPREYGAGFFEVLREHDLLLACPLAGDTPRSTWDALASGMPTLAFDTPFYKSMAAFSNAAIVTPWPEVEPFAEELLAIANNKRRLIPMVQSAVKTARENSGASWLKRRVAWVDELLSRSAA
ncbi:MAG TPA: glycosyltransferase [Polyangiales bacterium]|nr:glycosyltransferase [Polyangiales bacterium]